MLPRERVRIFLLRIYLSGNFILWIELLINFHSGLCESDITPVVFSSKIDVTVFLKHTSSYTIHDATLALLNICKHLLILWHVDSFLGNDREISNIQQPFLGNGSANRHERNNFTAIIAFQQKSGVLYTVRAEMS
jgi:hypothetical protein